MSKIANAIQKLNASVQSGERRNGVVIPVYTEVKEVIVVNANYKLVSILAFGKKRDHAIVTDGEVESIPVRLDAGFDKSNPKVTIKDMATEKEHTFGNVTIPKGASMLYAFN